MKKIFFLILFLAIGLKIICQSPAFNLEVLVDCDEISLDSVLKSKSFIFSNQHEFHSASSNCFFWIKVSSIEKWSENNYLLLGNNINNNETIYCIGDNNKVIKEIKIGTNQVYESDTYLPSIKLSEKYNSVLIKIRSCSFIKESFKIKTLKEVNVLSSSYLLLYTAVITILLILATYLSLLFVKSKRKVILYYLLYMLSVVFGTFFISNYGRYFIWNELPFSNTYLEGTMVVLLIVFYNLFASKATYLSSWSRILTRLNLAFIIIYPLLFVFSVGIQSTQLVAFFSKFFPGIALVLLIIMVVQNILNKNNNSNYFLAGFLFFFLGVILRIFINEGLINHTFFIEVVIFIGIVLEVIIFSYVVINHLDKEIIKGQRSAEKLLSSLHRIEELKARIEDLNNSFENSQNTALISIDESINDVLVSPLSKREIEVLNSIIKGNKYKEISEELHISINTLKTHVSRIYSKLEINNRVEAINKITKLAHLKNK